MSDVTIDHLPLWMQAGVYPARVDRALIDAIWNEGVLRGMTVVQRQAGANMSVDVTSGLDHLGDVVGATSAEDVLDRIFSEFCIGK